MQWGREEGVYLDELRELEEIFNGNIHVYQLNEGSVDDGDLEEALIREYEGEADQELAATIVRRQLEDNETDLGMGS